MLQSQQFHHTDVQFFSYQSLVVMHLLLLLIERWNKRIQVKYYHDIWNFMKGLHQDRHNDKPKNDPIDERLSWLWILKNHQIKIPYWLQLEIHDLSFISLIVTFNFHVFALIAIAYKYFALDSFQYLYFSLENLKF